MTEKFTRFDPVDHLQSDEDMAMYLDACLEEDPGDGSVVRAALNDIARARGMTQLARETGISREGLYKALSPAGKIQLGDAKSGPSAVSFTPNGKMALVTRDGDNKISVLTVDGSKVEHSKRDVQERALARGRASAVAFTGFG